MEKFKTKAQMNWEVGKEQEKEFICKMEQGLDKEGITELKELFAQIRQNEYRRGKEDTLKTRKIDEIQNKNKQKRIDDALKEYLKIKEPAYKEYEKKMAEIENEN